MSRGKRFADTGGNVTGFGSVPVGHAVAFDDPHEGEGGRSRIIANLLVLKLADLEGTDGINH